MQVGYTHNNQEVLRNYAEEIAESFQVQPREQPSYLWTLIAPYFPTWESAGSNIGRTIAATHGQQWSNATIDFVFRKIFQDETKIISRWSYEGIKQLISGTAQQTISEVTKLNVTPKALPVITAFCGVAGQITLPLVVTLVGFAYGKVMHSAEGQKSLGSLPLEQLFTIDPETGLLRNAFGHLLTEKDMKDIFAGTAEYTLIGKLVELCQEIDKAPEGDSEATRKSMIEALLKTYLIERQDGVVVFPDGTVRTPADKELMDAGLAILTRNNPRHDKKEIRKLIKLLARHSLLPFSSLSINDKIDAQDQAKKMPALFEGEQEWKNYIVRGQDGIYFVYKDCGNKKRGDIISHDRMKEILTEANHLELQRAANEQKELVSLIKSPSTYSELVEKLNQLDTPFVQAFLKGFVVERQPDQKMVYLDGTCLEEEEKQKLLQNLALLPNRNNLNDRSEKIMTLVKQLGAHIP